MSDTHRYHLAEKRYRERGARRQRLLESQERRGKTPAADRKAFRSKRRSYPHDSDRHSV